MRAASHQVPKAEKAASPLLAALRGELTPDVPFWLMRQAGRYLPEYRELRARAGSFLKLCYNPAFAAEVTLQPLRRFDMDAAILFSDILVVPQALGQQLDFVEGEGPKLGPLAIETLRYNPEVLSPMYETLRLVRNELPAEKALIGFAGAPWTLACYMVQGFGDGAFEKVKTYAFNNQEAFDSLINTLTEVTIDYLSSQLTHGADVVQLFDSWSGLLPEPYFMRWAVEPARRIAAAVRHRHPGALLIGFPRGAGALYPRYAVGSGMDGIGLDQHLPIGQAVSDLSQVACLQGNLDPEALLAGGDALRRGVEKILDAVRERPFIFNLGHGVIKETPPEHVAELGRLVRDFRR
jgi:uroporphyrinogen decarboxylase